LCAELSRLVYKRFDVDTVRASEIVDAVARVDCSHVEFFSERDSQAFLTVHRDGTLFVAFRGTEPSAADVLTDLEALLVPWLRGGNAHDGFVRAFNELWGRLGPRVAALARPIVFTGHSLGAALATLAASESAAADPQASRELVTFGSPRVGDATFVATLEGMSVSRYVDCCDLVTRIPPERVAVGPVEFGYRHVQEANPLYIDRNGVVRPGITSQEIREDRSLAREEYLVEYAWRRGTETVRDLADHAPLNYVSPLMA